MRFSDSTDGTTCETVTEELSTDYLGPASTILPGTFSRLGVAGTKALGDALLPDLDSEEMRLLEAVANLDESQFELLGHLTRLTPEGWDALALHLEADGGAQIADDGTVGPPKALSDSEDATGPSPREVLGDGTNVIDIYNLLTTANINLRVGDRNVKSALDHIDNDLGFLAKSNLISLRSGPGSLVNALDHIDNDLGFLTKSNLISLRSGPGSLVNALDHIDNDLGFLTKSNLISLRSGPGSLVNALDHIDNDLGFLTKSNLISFRSGPGSLVNALDHIDNDLGFLTKSNLISFRSGPGSLVNALDHIDNDLGLLYEIPGRDGEPAANVKQLLERMDQSLGLLHDIPVRPAAASLGPTIGARDNATDSSGLAVDPIRKDMHRRNVREMLTRMDTDLGSLLLRNAPSQEVVETLQTIVTQYRTLDTTVVDRLRVLFSGDPLDPNTPDLLLPPWKRPRGRSNCTDT